MTGHQACLRSRMFSEGGALIVTQYASQTLEPASDSFDVEAIRKDFPILAQRVRGKPLVYLDSAATSQKPKAVIDAINSYYQSENAAVHRSIHSLSAQATLS